MADRIELYSGQKYYRVEIDGVTRELPLVQVDDGLWIASNAGIILGDIEFICAAARAMTERLKPLGPEIIVTPESKAIAFSYEVAKSLGHRRLIIGRKSVKAYMKDYLVEEVKSITTRERQTLVLTSEDIEIIAGRKICVLDDVVSTGGTIKALERLVKKAGGRIACKAAIWLEGPWYREELIHLGELPVFVAKDKSKILEENST